MKEKIFVILGTFGITLFLMLLFNDCEAQIHGNLTGSFLYNTDIIYDNHKVSVPNYEWKSITHNYHQNYILEADVYVPFKTFKDSPLQSNKFFFYGKGGVIMDGTTVRNAIWRFNLEYKPFKSELIWIQAEVNAIQTTGYKNASYNEPRLDGEELSIGIHYNNQRHGREYPNLVNFYAQLDYLIHSKYITIEPYVSELNQNNSTAFKTTLGIVININDVFYVEQGMITLNEQFLFNAITFTPYNSYYNTKFWLNYKKGRLFFEHICYHSLYSSNPNPLISGVSNRVGINYEF